MTDESSLIKRLRSHGTALYRPDHPTGLLLWEAASTLEDQARLIAGTAVVLELCADDLEAELKARWCTEKDGSCHPALQSKLDRDMSVVDDARALLTKLNAFERAR